MKNILLFTFISMAAVLLGLIAATSPNDQDEPKILDSKIEQVIVFVDGAQIIRKAQTQLTAGKNELVIRGISPYLLKESIRLEAEGKLTVLSVVHQPNHLVQQKKREEIDELEKQMVKINEQLAQEESLMSVYQQEEKMLSENQKIGGEQTGVSVENLKQAIDFHRQRLTEVKFKQLEQKKKITDLKGEYNKINKQLLARNAEQNESTSEILIEVEAQQAGLAKFTVSYYVGKAGWYPNYDLRVKDINSPIALNYKANVFQSTGEDWNQVKLTLSNGNPTQSGTKPELETWYLSYGYPRRIEEGLQGRASGIMIDSGTNKTLRGRIVDENGEPIPGVSIFMKGTSTGTVSDVSGFYSINARPGDVIVISAVGLKSQEVILGQESTLDVIMGTDTTELGEVVVTGYATNRGLNQKDRFKKEKDYTPVPVTTQQNQTSVTFEIAIPYTIPTDGKTYTVEIKEHEVPATYEYYCAPKLDPEAFLTAKITDWESYNLLDGEANLFFEGSYLGKSFLSVQNLSDTLSLSLGRDKNVVVTRSKQKDFSRKRILGGDQIETRSWDIQLRNTKKQAIRITIEDQFPVSTNKEIEINRLEWSNAELKEDSGKLTWKFELKPNEEKKLNFQYEVKYPRGKVIVLE
ncbi:MAG: mucoidy inhibitor MuiA family protein [Microscillaceae bacterium]|nr:mucoidy inhibitor MuiA family protein [Microscillaceae bacterium]